MSWKDRARRIDTPPPEEQRDEQIQPAWKDRARPVEAAAPREPVSKTKSATLGAAQGATFGFVDELGGALGKLVLGDSGVKLGKGVELSPDDTPEMREIKLELLAQRDIRPSSYELVRDNIRREADQAREDNPKTFLAGEIGAGVASSVIPGALALKGAGTAAKAATLGRVAATGAGLGGVAGLGNSEADLSEGEFGRAALDTGVGAAGGAVFGSAGYGVGKASPIVFRWLRQKLENAAVNQGRKVLLNGADSLARVKPVSHEAVRQTLEAGAITPGGTTASALRRLEDRAEQLGAQYGAIVDRLEELGVRGPEAETVARQLLRRAQERFGSSAATKTSSNVLESEANNLLALARPEEATSLLAAQSPRAAPRLGLRQAESVKRDLQKQARLDRLTQTGAEEAREEAASMLRQAVEDSVEQAGLDAAPYSELALMADEFVPTKRALAPILEARAAAERGAAAASKRGSSVTPGALEVAGTMATGNPAILLSKAASAAAKNYMPSTIAATAYGLSKAARSAALNPRRGMYGGELGASTERSIMPTGDGPPVRVSKATTPKDIRDMALYEPEALGKFAGVFAEAAKRGEDSVRVTEYLLAQTSPEWRKLRSGDREE